MYISENIKRREMIEKAIIMGPLQEKVSITPRISLLGIGIAKIKLNQESLEIIYQKGIGYPLIQNLVELYKEEMLDKKRGNSFIPLDDYTFFINYFQHKDNIVIIIYMDEKESNLSYPQLYILTKKISSIIRLNPLLSALKSICLDCVKIPKAKDIIGLLIIGANGSPFYSKIREESIAIEEKEVQISGFISALFSFAREIMGKDSTSELKEINFGDRCFYMINKNNVIFAYLVEKINPLLERYMYIISDEFVHKYKKDLTDFTGDITPFYTFEDNVNQYFNINGCE